MTSRCRYVDQPAVSAGPLSGKYASTQHHGVSGSVGRYRLPSAQHRLDEVGTQIELTHPLPGYDWYNQCGSDSKSQARN